MKRILVPFDGSSRAQRALVHAATLTGDKADAWLLLLNVQPPVDLETVDARERMHEQSLRGMAVLADAEALAAAYCIPCELDVRTGCPTEQILAAAEDAGCSAIVMGADEAGDHARRVHASAPVPVTLVH
jgi:nucleotide-binding universal stress UspA family protein